jgi:AmiR/NasT family two-component response regulator
VLFGKTIFLVFNGAPPESYLIANIESFGMTLVDELGDAEFLIYSVDTDSWEDVPEESDSRPVVVGWISKGVALDIEATLATGLDSLICAEMTLAEQKLSLLMGLRNRDLVRRLRDRILKVTEQARSASVIERAKLILGESRSYSDLEAYRFLRDQSMKKRVSIVHLAHSIVETHDIFS